MNCVFFFRKVPDRPVVAACLRRIRPVDSVRPPTRKGRVHVVQLRTVVVTKRLIAVQWRASTRIVPVRSVTTRRPCTCARTLANDLHGKTGDSEKTSSTRRRPDARVRVVRPSRYLLLDRPTSIVTPKFDIFNGERINRLRFPSSDRHRADVLSSGLSNGLIVLRLSLS